MLLIQPAKEQCFISKFEANLQSSSEGFEPSSNDGNHNQKNKNTPHPSIHRFLQLLQVVVQGHQKRTREELLVDYSKDIILTSEQYLQSMEMKAERKEMAKREAEVQKLEVEKREETRVAEKLQKEAEKVDACSKEAFKQKLSRDAICQEGSNCSGY